MMARSGEFTRPGWAAPAWALAVVLSFAVSWPMGLAVLLYLAWTGRLRRLFEDGLGTALAFTSPGRGKWFNLHAEGRRFRGSGNEAFDQYREETLRRLEEEQREFQDYLERLRRARDKAEFDGFMSERRRKGTPQHEPETSESV